MENLINVLERTLDPAQSNDAGVLLNQIKKIFNFCPNLLQIAMSNEINDGVRQAAAIALKNNVCDAWQVIHDPTVYSIHEDDKNVIRANILTGIVTTNSKIRSMLLAVFFTMVKNDFPNKWPNLPIKISELILSEDRNNWLGGYSCLMMLVKSYKYKNNKERGPLNEHMSSFLEIMGKHMEFLFNDESEWSCSVQKLIVKIYYTYTLRYLSLNIMTHQVFNYWVNLLCHIISRQVPESVDLIDVEERPATIWWNCKKWAIHTIFIYISKYGNPSGVTKYYKDFSKWFLGSCAETIIRVLFVICEQYSLGRYISPKCMSYLINNFEYMIKNAACWNYLKPHFNNLLKEVLFKILSYTSDDEARWSEDPVAYCQTMFEVLDDDTPASASAKLLKDVCVKRKGVLDVVMKFVMGILDSQEADPIQKDAAFHIIGSVAEILVKKPHYADSMESFIINYVMPVFQAPQAFRRYRTCWLIRELADVNVKNFQVFKSVSENMLNLILHDNDLVVKTMASVSLCEVLMNEPNEVKPLIIPHLSSLLFQMLTLLRESEVDELNDAIQTIIGSFSTEVIPIASEIAKHLKDTLLELLEEDITDEREMVILGIINSLQYVVNATENQPEVIASIEPLIVSIIEVIFVKQIVMFYEEALQLAAGLTTCRISPVMWQVLFFLKNIVMEDSDQIPEMMPLLTNYLSVDKASLVSDTSRIDALLEIVKIVFDCEEGLDSYQTYAAKIMEILLINFKGQINQYVPKIIELAVCRLMKPIEYTELTTLCLQVILAAVYYDQELTMNILMNHNWPGTNNLMINEFIKRLFEEISHFMGIHDRKLYIIGMTMLISMPRQQRPQALNEIGNSLMPKLISMMETLKNTYVKSKEDDSETDSQSDAEINELNSDEDEEEAEAVAYLEMLDEDDNDENNNGFLEEVINGEESEDSEFDEFTTELECFETDIDTKECEYAEFIHIYNVISQLNTSDPEWYQVLVSSMSTSDQNTLKAIIDMANKEIASREKEKSGETDTK